MQKINPLLIGPSIVIDDDAIDIMADLAKPPRRDEHMMARQRQPLIDIRKIAFEVQGDPRIGVTAEIIGRLAGDRHLIEPKAGEGLTKRAELPDRLVVAPAHPVKQASEGIFGPVTPIRLRIGETRIDVVSGDIGIPVFDERGHRGRDLPRAREIARQKGAGL